MKTELTINVRPLRHVYFTAENDITRFTDVASFCCTQWGGINNLIIPIPAAESEGIHDLIQKDSLYIQLINRRNPDIFIDAISLTEEENSFYKSLMSWLALEYPGKPIINWETFLTTDSSLHPLSILPSQTGVSKHVLPLAVFPHYAKVSGLEKAIRCAALGTIWTGQEREYREVFELRVWPIDMPGASLYAQLSTVLYESVINLTLKELHNIGTEAVFPALHFDIVIAQTVLDLCWFWNLRAYSFGHQWLDDRRVLILSKNQLLQETFLEPLIRILRERRRHAYMTSNVDVVFHHNHDDEINEFLGSRSELQRQSESFQIKMQMSHRDNNSEEMHQDSAHSDDGTGFKPIRIVWQRGIIQDRYMLYIHIKRLNNFSSLIILHNGMCGTYIVGYHTYNTI